MKLNQTKLLTKIFSMAAFSMFYVYKNILDLDGLKCDLMSGHAAEFAKQTSSIQEVTAIIRKLN